MQPRTPPPPPPLPFSDLVEQYLQSDQGEALSQFELVSENEYRSRSLGLVDNDDSFPCTCTYESGVNKLRDACGQGSGCINRELFIECLPGDCPCGEYCQNRRFQRKERANVEVFKTEKKGFGLRALEDLKPGTFVMEYVGEVMPYSQFIRRTLQYHNSGNQHFYFMSLQKGEIIDAQNKGCLARFINHSCSPNCATQKWIVGNQLRIGIVTIKLIPAGTELAFDYKFERYGEQAQECFCNEPNCKGYIGIRKNGDAPTGMFSLAENDLDDDDDEADLISTIPRKKRDKKAKADPYTDSEEIIDAVRILYRCKPDKIKEVIVRLLKSDTNWLREFLRFHGVIIAKMILRKFTTDDTIVKTVLELLQVLPFTVRNKITESKLDDIVVNFCTNHDEEITSIAQQLSETWKDLPLVYKIPRLQKSDTGITPPTKLNSEIPEERKRRNEGDDMYNESERPNTLPETDSSTQWGHKPSTPPRGDRTLPKRSVPSTPEHDLLTQKRFRPFTPDKGLSDNVWGGPTSWSNEPWTESGSVSNTFGSTSDTFNASTNIFGGGSNSYGGSLDKYGGSSNTFSGVSNTFGGASNSFGTAPEQKSLSHPFDYAPTTWSNEPWTASSASSNTAVAPTSDKKSISNSFSNGPSSWSNEPWTTTTSSNTFGGSTEQKSTPKTFSAPITWSNEPWTTITSSTNDNSTVPQKWPGSSSPSYTQANHTSGGWSQWNQGNEQDSSITRELGWEPPLPPYWRRVHDDQGQALYINLITAKAQIDFPDEKPSMVEGVSQSTIQDVIERAQASVAAKAAQAAAEAQLKLMQEALEKKELERDRKRQREIRRDKGKEERIKADQFEREKKEKLAKEKAKHAQRHHSQQQRHRDQPHRLPPSERESGEIENTSNGQKESEEGKSQDSSTPLPPTLSQETEMSTTTTTVDNDDSHSNLKTVSSTSKANGHGSIASTSATASPKSNGNSEHKINNAAAEAHMEKIMGSTQMKVLRGLVSEYFVKKLSKYKSQLSSEMFKHHARLVQSISDSFIILSKRNG